MLTPTNLIASHEFSHTCKSRNRKGGTVPGSGGHAAEILRFFHATRELLEQSEA